MAYPQATTTANNGVYSSTSLPPAGQGYPGTTEWTSDLGPVWSDGTNWLPIGAFTGTASTLSVSVAAFGIVSSTTLDQTTLINAAAAKAVLGGFSLYWPPGVYIYSNNLLTSVSWIGAGAELVELRKNTTLGAGAPVQIQAGNVKIFGITFNSPNTPSNAINNAVFGDTCLIAQSLSNIRVDSCIFRKQFGTCVFFQSISTGRIINNAIYTCYKDGFHITGLSTDIERINNVVEDGGDDAFPVPGYASGNPVLGQPTGILDANNVVRGVKFGSAFKYVGAVDVSNVGCKVDGNIPASYGRANTLMSCCAMNIGVDTGASTFGCEEIQVTGFQAINVGRGSAPFSNVLNAIEILGGTGQTVRNIRFTGGGVKNCASAGFRAAGAVTGGIDNLVLDGFSINNTTDPNGYVGTAGTAQFNGITLARVNNFSFKGTLADTGSNGISWDNTCTGEFDLVARSYRINAGAVVGARIFNSNGTTSSLSRLKMDLYMAAQVTATSGQPYYLDRIIAAQAAGVIESLRVEMDLVNAATGGFVILPSSYVSQTPGASPWTFINNSTTNPAGGRLLCIVQVGTAVGLTVHRGRTGAFGVANIPTVNTTLTLAFGESLLYTSSSGTPVLQVQPCDGV